MLPEFSPKLIAAFKLKVDNMSNLDKKSVLLVDEINWAKKNSYNIERDYVEGYEDLGGVIPVDKILRFAMGLHNRKLAHFEILQNGCQ